MTRPTGVVGQRSRGTESTWRTVMMPTTPARAPHGAATAPRGTEPVHHQAVQGGTGGNHLHIGDHHRLDPHTRKRLSQRSRSTTGEGGHLEEHSHKHERGPSNQPSSDEHEGPDGGDKPPEHDAELAGTPGCPGAVAPPPPEPSPEQPAAVEGETRDEVEECRGPIDRREIGQHRPHRWRGRASAMRDSASRRDRQAAKWAHERDQEVGTRRVRLSVEMRHTTECMKRDARDPEAESPSHERVRQLMKQDSAEEPERGHQPEQPELWTRRSRQPIRKVPGREHRRHERQRQKPGPMQADGDSEDAADGEGA